jgi:endo-1,4-beta-D-glucanase Y
MLRSIASLTAVVSVALLLGACSSNDSPDTKGGAQPEHGVGGSGGSNDGSGGSDASGGAPHEGEGGEAGEKPAGGSGNGGGSGGSGGTGTSGDQKLPPAKYGFFPETVSLEDAEEAYEYWKDTYVVDCGSAGKRVNTGEDETLAEAIGFGALLAVGWNDKKTFDGIATYYRKAGAATDALKSTKTGLMGWYVGPDACAFEEVYPQAAIGSDINVAMALLQAECRWGGGEYIESASKILKSVREAATKEVDGKIVLLPSDDSDSECSSPSYMAPGFFRVFAKAFPDDAEFWNQFADDTYVIIDAASKTVTKLAPDWAANSSTPCDSSGYVGYDGIRTGWRVATDYAWFGTEAAKKWMRASTSYIEEEVGTDQFVNVKDGFFADGEGMLIAVGLGNSAFAGAFAVASMATSQEVSDSFHEAFLDIPKENDDSYYSHTGRAIYLMLSANQFSPGCY